MQKAGGDTWVSRMPLITDKWVFKYKYCVTTPKGELIRYENGVDRIADLEILPNADACSHRGASAMTGGHAYERDHYAAKVMAGGKKVKTVRLDDEWNIFHLKFSTHYPEYHPNTEMRLKVRDDLVVENDYTHKVYGGYNMGGSAKPYEWLMNKYGAPVRAFERSLVMRNDKNNSKGQFYVDDDNTAIWYHYIFTSGKTGQVIEEREPQSQIEIQDPGTYSGQLGRRGTD